MSERSYRDIDQTIMLTVASVNLGLALGSILVAVLCGIAFIALHVAQARGATAPRYRKSVVYAMLVLGGIVWVLSPDYENAVSPFLVYIPAFFFMFLAFYQRLCRGNGGHDVFVLFNGLALLLFSCYNAHRISIGFNVLVLVLLIHAYGRPHVRWWKHILFLLLFACLTATSLAGLHYWRNHDYRAERAADYYAKRHLMGFDPVVKLGSFESNFAGKYNREVVLRVWDTLAPTYMRAAVYEKYVGGIWKLPAHRDRMLYSARYKVDYAVFETRDSVSSADSTRPVWVQSTIDNFGFIFAPYDAVAVAMKNADSVEYFRSNIFKQGETRRGDWFYYMPLPSGPTGPYVVGSYDNDTPDSSYLQVFAPLAAFLDTVAMEMGLDTIPDNPAILRPYRYSRAISDYFLHHFAYSLRVDESRVDVSILGAKSDPLRVFWTTRSGYCEYYATLSVLLLRRAGIKARYVTGFARPEVEPGRPYAIFRRNSSHAWVEMRNMGTWATFDPTPPLFVVKVERPSWLSMKFEAIRARAARYFHLLRDGEWRTLLSSWQDYTQRALSSPLFYGVLVFAVVALAVLLAVRAYRRREKESGYDAAIKQLVRNLETAEKSLASLNLRREPGETVTAFAERCRTFEPGTEKRRIQLRRALEFLDEYNKKRWLPVKSGKSA